MNQAEINNQRLLDTFFSLVQIDSPSGHEQGMTQELSKRMQTLNIETRTDEHGNVIAMLPASDDCTTEPAILLNAHIDTVEPGKNIEPIVDNGMIKSAGETILGADNKVAVAAILEILQTLIEQNISHRSLEIIFTTSEETGNYGAVGLDFSQLTATRGYTFDSGLPLGTIILASPFYNRFDITLAGTAAHASRPEQANSVLPIIQEALATIQLGRISENTVANIGIVEIGHARNTVPGTATISGEVRSFVREELDEVTEKITTAFQVAAADKNIQCSVDVVLENDGYLFDEQDLFVQETMQRIQAVGITPTTQKSSECFDANIFNSHGIPTLNIANNVQGMHTIDERIAVADLEQLAQIILEITTADSE